MHPLRYGASRRNSVARNGRAVDSIAPWCRATGAGVKPAAGDQPRTTGKRPALYAVRPASRRRPSRRNHLPVGTCPRLASRRRAILDDGCGPHAAAASPRPPRRGLVRLPARNRVTIDRFGGRRRTRLRRIVQDRREPARTCRETRNATERATPVTKNPQSKVATNPGSWPAAYSVQASPETPRQIYRGVNLPASRVQDHGEPDLFGRVQASRVGQVISRSQG